MLYMGGGRGGKLLKVLQVERIKWDLDHDFFSEIFCSWGRGNFKQGSTAGRNLGAGVPKPGGWGDISPQ